MPSEVPHEHFERIAEIIRMYCKVWDLPAPKITPTAYGATIAISYIRVPVPPPERSVAFFARFLFAKYLLVLSRSSFSGSLEKSHERVAQIIAGALGC